MVVFDFVVMSSGTVHPDLTALLASVPGCLTSSLSTASAETSTSKTERKRKRKEAKPRKEHQTKKERKPRQSKTEKLKPASRKGKASSTFTSTSKTNSADTLPSPLSIQFSPECLPKGASPVFDDLFAVKHFFSASKGFRLTPTLNIELYPNNRLVTRAQLQKNPPFYFETYIQPSREIPSNCIGKIPNPFQPPLKLSDDIVIV